MNANPANLSELLRGRDRVLVLSGAGISTAAGISDFRGPDGLWTRDPQAELGSTLEYFLDYPEIRQKAWQRRLNSGVWNAQPTAAHHAIAAFEQAGRVAAIVTQNTDGLHQLAGSTNVLEVHGSARSCHCETCWKHWPIDMALDQLRAGVADPRCPDDGGIVRADSILFGESLVGSVIEAALDAAENCDAVLALGTTLAVQPVAGLFPLAIGHGALGIIVNQGETSYDHLAQVVLDDDVQSVAPKLFWSSRRRSG